MFANSFGDFQNVECGLVYMRHSITDGATAVPVPLKSVSVEASIVHAVAQVELTQVYLNKEAQPIEAIYYFPVDSNGGVINFTAELDSRVIQGVVKPKEEAQAQYDKAIAENKTAFLLESKKPDVFKVRIGLLKPNSMAKILIAYVTEVKNEKGSNAMRFFIPTTVAPRYIPPSDADVDSLDLSKMTVSESTPANMAIKVNVAIQGRILSVTSPSHEIQVEAGDSIGNWNTAVVQLLGLVTDMNRDFLLHITPQEIHIARVYVETMENSTALMTHFIPEFNLAEQKCELIFLLDRSGSMAGTSIGLARNALTLFLHSLPTDCYFNIVGFGSSVKFFSNESMKYNDESLKKAIRHAKGLSADMGGTEILGPLKQIFAKRAYTGYLRQIFILTDGEVSNTNQVIKICKDNVHKARVFTLGIGSAASHHLVEGMAEAGGGTADFVSENEEFNAKILKQLQNAMQPALRNVTLKWTGIPDGIDDERPQNTLREVPGKIPPIFDGSQLLVFGLCTGALPTAVEILADSPNGRISCQMQITEENRVEVGSTGVIHKLAAAKAIRESELKLACFDYESEETENLKRGIVALALQHGLASKFTSFVAVDTQGSAPENDGNWTLQTRNVPAQRPHGSTCGVANSGRKLRRCRGLRRSRACTGVRSRACKRRAATASPKRSGCKAKSRRAASVGTKRGRSVSRPKRRDRTAKKSRTSTSAKSGTHIDSVDSSSSSDSENETPVQNKNSTPLQDIIATQSFNGSFALNDDFAKAIGKDLSAITTESKKHGWNENAWATALGLTYLSEKLPNLRASWELLSLKGRKWLRANHGSKMDAMLAAAKAFLKA